MYKKALLLFLLSCVCLYSEDSDVDKEALKAEYPNTSSFSEQIYSPSFSPPQPSFSYSEPRKFRVYGQSLIGTLMYKIDVLVFEGGERFKLHKGIKEDKSVSDWHSSMDKADPNYDKVYGKGLCSLQNIGVTFLDAISLSFGYYQSHSQAKFHGKRAVNKDRQLILHHTSKSNTEGFLSCFYWNMGNLSRLNWLSCQPFIGLGSGFCKTKTQYKGYANESKKKTNSLGFLEPLTINILDYWLSPTGYTYDPTSRWIIDNSVTHTTIPFIFDVGVDIGTCRSNLMIFDVTLGFRLQESKSKLSHSSFYAGAKLEF